jgi:hypothetical protein
MAWLLTEHGVSKTVELPTGILQRLMPVLDPLVQSHDNVPDVAKLPDVGPVIPPLD